MKINYKSLILLLITHNLFSQSNKDVKHYYDLVNGAEMNIASEKYDSALLKYKQSLKYLSQFSDDSYNALLCALECKKFEDATVFASKLINKGVPTNFFYKKKIFNILTKSKYWDKYVSTQPKPKYNLNLHNVFDSLVLIDQKYRIDDIRFRDSMLIIDSMINEKVWSIFKQNGFPTEDLLGLWMYNDSTINFGWNPFDVIMIHQIKNNREEFVDFLTNSVHSGKMSNGKYVTHSKNFLPNKLNLYGCLREIQAVLVQVEDELLTCCCEEESQIDKNRSKIYLEPLTEKRRKSEFMHDKNVAFIIPLGVAVYSSSKGSDDLKKLKNELINDKKFIIYKKLNSNASYLKQ